MARDGPETAPTCLVMARNISKTESGHTHTPVETSTRWLEIAPKWLLESLKMDQNSPDVTQDTKIGLKIVQGLQDGGLDGPGCARTARDRARTARHRRG